LRIAKGSRRSCPPQPRRRRYFAQREEDVRKRLADAQKRWDGQMAPYKGTKIVTYHRRGRTSSIASGWT
jgi:hypothetical protein